jgi:hypothetical protein
MNWISVEEKMPLYNETVLIFYDAGCDDCDTSIDHFHKLNFVGDKITTGKWDKASPDTVSYYHSLNDNSWDWLSEDHWSELNGVFSDGITHWMPIPRSPKYKE